MRSTSAPDTEKTMARIYARRGRVESRGRRPALVGRRGARRRGTTWPTNSVCRRSTRRRRACSRTWTRSRSSSTRPFPPDSAYAPAAFALTVGMEVGGNRMGSSAETGGGDRRLGRHHARCRRCARLLGKHQEQALQHHGSARRALARRGLLRSRPCCAGQDLFQNRRVGARVPVRLEAAPHPAQGRGGDGRRPAVGRDDRGRGPGRLRLSRTGRSTPTAPASSSARRSAASTTTSPLSASCRPN